MIDKNTAYVRGVITKIYVGKVATVYSIDAGRGNILEVAVERGLRETAKHFTIGDWVEIKARYQSYMVNIDDKRIRRWNLRAYKIAPARKQSGYNQIFVRGLIVGMKAVEEHTLSILVNTNTSAVRWNDNGKKERIMLNSIFPVFLPCDNAKEELEKRKEHKYLDLQGFIRLTKKPGTYRKTRAYENITILQSQWY